MTSVTLRRALLILALTAIALAPLGATGAQQAAAAPAVVEVDWYVNLTWWTYAGAWGSDMFSRLIEDEYGLKLNFIVPAQEGGAQINTMIAGGELPDLLTLESWLEYRRRMAQAGLLYAYDDLIDRFDPSFRNIIKTDIFNWYQESDGKTYGLPNFAYSTDDLEPGRRLPTNAGFVLRTDLYDAIGRPNIDTADRFLDALERVKALGTYEGRPIVPLQLYEFTDTGNTSVFWLSQYFGTPFEDRNGNLLHEPSQEQYFQVIKFLNEAYRRGLLSPEAFTDTREQINQKVASGRSFALLTAPQDFQTHFRALYESDNNATFEGFVVRNYNGEDPQISDIAGFGWLTTSVAADAKVPDRIVKLIHFLYSDKGQETVYFGFEGETFNYLPDGRIEYTPKWLGMTPQERNAAYGLGFNMFMNHLWSIDKRPLPAQRWNFGMFNEYEWKSVADEYSYDGKSRAFRADPDDPRADRIQTLGAPMGLYWGRQLPRMITAPSESAARAIWEESLAELRKMGLDEIMAYNNENFRRAKQTLGYEFAWPPNRR